jgi:hypothetical protein
LVDYIITTSSPPTMTNTTAVYTGFAILGLFIALSLILFHPIVPTPCFRRRRDNNHAIPLAPITNPPTTPQTESNA